MNPMDLIFGQVENAVRSHASRDTPGPEFDAEPLLGNLRNILGGGQQGGGGGLESILGGLMGGGGGQQVPQQGTRQNPLSSDQDPYGDPGLQGGGVQQTSYGNAISSDQDPYGDPGLQGGGRSVSQDPRQDPRFRNAKSSDEDPYGDPGLR